MEGRPLMLMHGWQGSSILLDKLDVNFTLVGVLGDDDGDGDDGNQEHNAYDYGNDDDRGLTYAWQVGMQAEGRKRR